MLGLPREFPDTDAVRQKKRELEDSVKVIIVIQFARVWHSAIHFPEKINSLFDVFAYRYTPTENERRVFSLQSLLRLLQAAYL